jgi:imidazole glycerol-phosphate synthase subunit HisF
VDSALAYNQAGADELVFLDITATHEKRGIMLEVAARVADQVFIPFTVGGGISSLEDAKKLLLAGADKISLNSAAVKNPSLIKELSDHFGSQAVVVAIDARNSSGWEVFVGGGRTATGLDAASWAEQAARLGAGEILLTSMDADGTKKGFDLPLTEYVARAVEIPVIASGGAGTPEHFAAALQPGLADAALAASVFHFGEIFIPDLKHYLLEQGIPVRPID